jgi:hypothetical protein
MKIDDPERMAATMPGNWAGGPRRHGSGGGESVEQTMAALRDEGLIEATGEYREGRPVYAVTQKASCF